MTLETETVGSETILLTHGGREEKITVGRDHINTRMAGLMMR